MSDDKQMLVMTEQMMQALVAYRDARDGLARLRGWDLNMMTADESHRQICRCAKELANLIDAALANGRR